MISHRQKNCPRCGAQFPCGPALGCENCWCAELPHIGFVAEPDVDCLCPKCLTAEIAAHSSHAATTAPGANEKCRGTGKK